MRQTSFTEILTYLLKWTNFIWLKNLDVSLPDWDTFCLTLQVAGHKLVVWRCHSITWSWVMQKHNAYHNFRHGLRGGCNVFCVFQKKRNRKQIGTYSCPLCYGKWWICICFEYVYICIATLYIHRMLLTNYNTKWLIYCKRKCRYFALHVC